MLASWMALTVAAALSASTPTTTETTADWQADYGKALEQTRSDDRPLLVVIDSPSDETQRVDPTLLDPQSGKFPLEKYDLCHVDVTTEYGKQVAEAFSATTFPHVSIIDRSGSVILHKQSGAVSEKQWNDALAKHERGLRRGEGSYRVSKPTVSASDITVSGYGSAAPMQYTQPYCPSCQRR
ncbi:hypothetical protein Mal64_18990 [Pseudobythopirellula maris]|uniref:Thioredoxin family protein n=1 Tax=Pseudobythopirellula maris TaxID=2527991 RepID=A0A5C5ZMN4_9BACT|nr:thioredoxin family protein [Pseudobythopirellula maris]TWT88418.1 hypothetical protein Mal64_18990 [Pseudobythopirellula maris]